MQNITIDIQKLGLKCIKSRNCGLVIVKVVHEKTLQIFKTRT